MMKHLIFTGALMLASALTEEAMAQCSVGGGWTRVSALNSTLANKTACDASATYDRRPKHPDIPVMGIQEEHHSDGQLWDFKCGPAGYTSPPLVTACGPDPKHPTLTLADRDRKKQVGTWSVLRNNTTAATVRYTYPPGGTQGPALAVFFNSSTGVYDFCTPPPPNVGTSVGNITLVATGAGTSRVCPP